jgi:hypothetical protein
VYEVSFVVVVVVHWQRKKKRGQQEVAVFAGLLLPVHVQCVTLLVFPLLNWLLLLVMSHEVMVAWLLNKKKNCGFCPSFIF